jgi:hypothetical protein
MCIAENVNGFLRLFDLMLACRSTVYGEGRTLGSTVSFTFTFCWYVSLARGLLLHKFRAQACAGVVMFHTPLLCRYTIAAHTHVCGYGNPAQQPLWWYVLGLLNVLAYAVVSNVVIFIFWKTNYRYAGALQEHESHTNLPFCRILSVASGTVGQHPIIL